MPILNFQAQFADDVEQGRKRQTIRRRRKHPIRPGDRLFLYTGLRTKDHRKLGEVIVTCVRDIAILETCVKIDGTALCAAGCDELARADGFADFAEMREWFKARYGLPLRGADLIEW